MCVSRSVWKGDKVKLTNARLELIDRRLRDRLNIAIKLSHPNLIKLSSVTVKEG